MHDRYASRIAHPRLLAASFRRAVLLAAVLPATLAADETPDRLELKKGDRVVFVGNTFAERLRLFNQLEALLTARFPRKVLTFRNMGWPADAVDKRPRPLNFGSMESHLKKWDADVLVACFGMAESFRGKENVDAFRKKLARYVDERLGMGLRLALVSPIAHEDVGGRLPDPTAHNKAIAAYTAAMKKVARDKGVPFVDLYTPTHRWYEEHPDRHLTFNGIHLTRTGAWVVAGMLAKGLGYGAGTVTEGPAKKTLEKLRRTIDRKSELFFHRWRAVNAEYIYGRRRKPYGVKHFPQEMAKLEKLIAKKEKRIHALARRLPSAGLRPPRPEATGRLIGPPESVGGKE